ncbi:hypothetical protein HB364_29020 [Pseudoflavitalea sp. X16]|uniref:hypothetical protein n=1 Tax=Paraflavitalea devenefica TaxID=2716334 RepID=UPI001421FA6D|nr:hypothetical protein [Paraflavitalea devenefica]NII29156.1 hypothetical protein [Paraflavitalea devenefica]
MVYKNKKSRKAIPGYTLIPKEGYYQVRKIGLTKDRVNNDPAFSMTRKLSDEFAVAAKLGTLIRDAVLEDATIAQHPAVLTAALINIIQTDKQNPVGCRSLLNADFSSLENFQFNPSLSWQEATKLHEHVKVDRKKRQWSLTIPAFVPRNAIKGPRSATYCRLRFIQVSIDLTGMVAEKQIQRTTLLPWKHLQIPQQELVFKLHKTAPCLHLLVATINWYESVGHAKVLMPLDTQVPFTILKVGVSK